VAFHVKHDDDDGTTLRSQAAALGTALTREAEHALLAYEQFLRERGAGLGVVSPRDASRIRARHILDSLRAVEAIRPEDVDAYDLGSGGGLPGMVIAAAVPDLKVGLVETRRRRLAFLELVLERLGLPNASVIPSRIEDLSKPVDLCFARALAPVAKSWALARPLLRAGGRLVYFAGHRVDPTLVVPERARIEVRETPLLESAGPLVIMSQQ
jgi:16S rRNA (guanine527-N7)-methyltransferase